MSSRVTGGYICNTQRLQLTYDQRQLNGRTGLPASMILKAEAPGTQDHQTALELCLYSTEWHFYEKVSQLVGQSIRVPTYYASVYVGGRQIGVLMEDLAGPGAELCPVLDESGVLLVIEHCAKLHAGFWNTSRLDGLGIHRVNYWRVIRDKVEGYWPGFRTKWSDRLSVEEMEVFGRVVKHIGWIQDQLWASSRLRVVC